MVYIVMAYTGSAEDVVVVNEQLLADVVDDLARRPEFRERRRPSALPFFFGIWCACAVCGGWPTSRLTHQGGSTFGLRLRATLGC